MTYDPGVTQQLPSPPRRARRKLWIGILVGVCGVLTCCAGVSAVSAVTGHRQAPRPATAVDTPSGTSGPTYSPVPSLSPSPSPSSSPPPVATPAPAPAEPVPPPAAAPTRQDPPPGPAGDAGTPTVAGIRAGEFCKRVLAGTYAYDDKGELLYCGPVGATHPRWSHA